MTKEQENILKQPIMFPIDQYKNDWNKQCAKRFDIGFDQNLEYLFYVLNINNPFKDAKGQDSKTGTTAPAP